MLHVLTISHREGLARALETVLWYLHKLIHELQIDDPPPRALCKTENGGGSAQNLRK